MTNHAVLHTLQVCTERKWTQIANKMGYDTRDGGESIPGQLKVAYSKIIHPFELYRIKVSQTMANNNSASPVAASASTTKASPGGRMRATPPNPSNTASSLANGSPMGSPITMERVQAASAKLNEALGTQSIGDAEGIPKARNSPSTPGTTTSNTDSECWSATFRSSKQPSPA